MLILLFLLSLGGGDAAARLAEIRARFPTRAKAESVNDLERLARAAPSTEAGGQAAAWLGALALEGGDRPGARIWFERAVQSAGEGRRLGLRGLGDLAMGERAYHAALQQYSVAAGGASGILLEELRQKIQLARTFERRQRVEWAAWLLVLGAFAYFLLRALRGRGPLRPPTEAVYVLPVYLLLILGALGRDELVVRALLYSAACSLLIIVAAGLAARRAPPRGGLRWLQALLLVAANAALFYAVLNRTGLVDKLIMTAQM